MDFMPDYCETSIGRRDYFTVDLPITAFGIPGDEILRLSVEHGKAVDDSGCCANVWASRINGRVKFFVYALTVPGSADQEQAIFDALNGSDEFMAIMREFIEEVVLNLED